MGVGARCPGAGAEVFVPQDNDARRREDPFVPGCRIEAIPLVHSGVGLGTGKD